MSTPTTPPYIHVPDLAHAQDVPAKGTLSRTLANDAQQKVVLFTFAAGEELSEHTASMPATMHFLSGAARVTVAGDHLAAGPGTWIHMAPHVPHSIRTDEPVVMLLTLFKNTAPATDP